MLNPAKRPLFRQSKPAFISISCSLWLALVVSPAAAADSPSGDSYNLRYADLEVTSAEAQLVVHQAAATDKAKSGSGAGDASKCATFEKNIDADVGDIIRAGCKPTTAQMSKLMNNPLGNVAMLFTQFDLYELENPVNGKIDFKWNYMGIAQFPKAISENWNLINRIVWNVPSMPMNQSKIDNAQNKAEDYSSFQGATVAPSGSPPAPIDVFSGHTAGFGDMYYVGLFSPKEGIKHKNGATSVWGLGFDLGFPTASEELLGSGKYTAGPSAIYAYLGEKWKLGGLLQQYTSFAGDSDRDDVNMMNLQYLYYYSLNGTTSIGAMPNIIANWEQSSGNVWTVPVGFGINKTFQFGKVPVRIGLEAYYSVIEPNDVVGSNWDYRLYITPAAPSALFKWMQ